MNEIKQWIEEHPYLTGGAVLAIVILYFLLSSGSSQSAAQSQGVGGSGLSSSDYASLQEAQIAAGTQLQEQTNAATVQNNTLSAQLAAAQLNAQAQTQQEQIAANVQLQNIASGQSVSENTNAAQLALGQAQIGGQVQLGQISAAENDTLAGTQEQGLADEYSSAVASQKLISDAQTAQATVNAQTQDQIAQYAASVQLGAQGVQNFATQTAGNVQLAGIAAQSSVDNNSITTQGEEYNTGVAGTVSEQQNYLNYLSQTQNAGINLVESGALNKGGSGGANQVSFLSTLMGGSGAAPTPTSSNFGISIPGVGSVGISNP